MSAPQGSFEEGGHLAPGHVVVGTVPVVVGGLQPRVTPAVRSRLIAVSKMCPLSSVK